MNLSINNNIMPSVSTCEKWIPVDPIFMDGMTGYTISDYGNLKLNNELIIPTNRMYHNNYGLYKTININRRPVYYHVLVWKSFKNDKTKNRVLFTKYELDDNGFLKCPIENLYSRTSNGLDISAIIPTIDNLIPIICQHPKYGPYYKNKWMNVRSHSYENGKETIINYDDYEIMMFEDSNNPVPFLIRSTKRSNDKYITIFDEIDPMVSLRRSDGVDKKYMLTHVVLCSYFPNIKTEPHVDHINDDPTNNDITNLQWLSISANARKGQAKSVLTPRKGMSIETLYPNGITQVYISIADAARGAKEYLNTTTECKTIENKIRLVIRGDLINYKKLKFKDVSNFDVNLPGENWLPYPHDTDFQVSNMGRVKNSFNHISSNDYGRNGKYSMVSVRNKKKYIHHLVWETFKGPIPDGEIIRHDDLAPLNDGVYRNWLIDLDIGDHNKNNKDYYEACRIKSQIDNCNNVNITNNTEIKTPQNICLPEITILEDGSVDMTSPITESSDLSNGGSIESIIEYNPKIIDLVKPVESEKSVIDMLQVTSPDHIVVTTQPKKILIKGTSTPSSIKQSSVKPRPVGRPIIYNTPEKLEKKND